MGDSRGRMGVEAHSLFPLKFLSLVVVQDMEGTNCQGWA